MAKKKQSKTNANSKNNGKSADEKAASVLKPKSLKKNSAIPGWIIAGLSLVLVVVLFIYAQNSISKVEDDKKEIESQTRVLKNTVNNLQQEVTNLNQKAENLEESTKKSDEFLFNENMDKRTIPDSVDTKDWQVYKDDEWRMTLTYPQSWQISQSAAAQATEGDQKVEARKNITLEPINQTDYLRSLQIIPYDFGQAFPVDEKVKVFESKGILDIQVFNDGKLVYFIDRVENLVIPTIMILSDHGDYKAIFRVNNFYHTDYFTFLTDFEKIIAVTKIEPAPAPEPPAEEPKEEEPKEE